MDKSNYNDVFIPEDGIGAGRLVIDGKDTSLKLFNSTDAISPSIGLQDHHGILNDGSKASLLKCIQTGYSSYGVPDSSQIETSFFPHYVLIGDAFVTSDEPIIESIRYHFENADCLVNTMRDFGTMYPEREEFSKILEADQHRRKKIAQEHGWEPTEIELGLGNRPILQYFSGRHEIVQCELEFGSASIGNRVKHGLGGPKGVSISNEVTASLKFASPSTLGNAITALGTFHSFFELCLGKRQRYLWIEVQLANRNPKNSDSRSSNLRVYWSYCNDRISGETAPTQYGDVLVDAGERQVEFETVLAGWLNSTAEVGNARNRFAQAFYSPTYDVDRLVGGANMFDLLPSTHVPSKVETDERTAKAVQEAHRSFKALPDSFARQSVLSALGRVGMPSLRDKICHRASIVSNVDPERFAELHLPCGQAVLCRNHFVHGSKAEFDYNDETSSLLFLSDTLEFVFATSHLIELGWDYSHWLSKWSSMSHKFGSYVHNYNTELSRLKELIGTQ